MRPGLFLFSILLLATRPFAQTVSVDPTFNIADRGFNYGGAFNGPVRDVIVMSDGRSLICGGFTEYNGSEARAVVRLLPNGDLDTTFHVATGPDGVLCDMALQPDGKLLVLGHFFYFDGSLRWGIARLLEDGSLDQDFVPGEAFYGQPEALALQPDGKILMGGWQDCGTGIQRCIKRLNTDGSLDTDFDVGVGVNASNQPIYSIRVLNNGKIMIAGWFYQFNGQQANYMTLLNADGSMDNSFPNDLFNGRAEILAVCPDGDMIVAGAFTTVGGVAKDHIAKVSTAGGLDPSFNATFELQGEITYSLFCAVARADGRIVVGGLFDECNGVEVEHIVRLMPDGSVDPTFTTPYTGIGGGQILHLSERPDGRLMIGGMYNNYSMGYSYGLTQALPDGAIDLSFNPGSGVNWEVNALTVQPDGKTLIAGKFSRVNSTWTPCLARLNTDGTLDPSFNTGTGMLGQPRKVSLRSDGRILIAGGNTYSGQPVLDAFQLATDGTLDPSFAVNAGSGHVMDMIEQADGKLLVSGAFTTINGIALHDIVRFNQDGSLDASFDAGSGAGTGYIDKIAFMPDGRIVISGHIPEWDGNTTGHIVRLLPDGSMDQTFTPGTGFNNTVYDMLVMPDGRIVAGGLFTSYNGVPRVGIARLNVDGTLDTSFDPGYGLNGLGLTLALDIDGSVMIGGQFEMVDSIPASHVVRLTPNGTVDPDFSIGAGFTWNGYGGVVRTVNDLELLPNGQLIAVGTFTAFDGVGRNRLVRLMAPTTASVREEHMAGGMRAWPNPSDGSTVQIELPELPLGTNTQLSVVDACGRIVWSANRSVNGPLLVRFEHALVPGTYQLVSAALGSLTRVQFMVCRP